ncbi:probable G-protein coupled receptor B0563.6 [Diorhabda sublineata]|uniref:probable G-protein coupled receptor B0563.6 n=1 Tax=Diorhabda sublineata TaxID=1163346 RepID=UPI0024E10ED8|nr:probable G-protein coupled receptor B0563.6 [Diorhabda sublineata]
MSLLYSSESTAAQSLCLNNSTTECLPCNLSDNVGVSFFGRIPELNEDPRTEVLRRYSYAFALPSICFLGIIGNIFNLIVLTRRNMRGPAYIYMRGYSLAALLALLCVLPFAWRVFVHREQGHWEDSIPAYYFAHLELFLGNSCLGIGVMMLLALTLERYVSVCHPGHARPILGSPVRVVTIIPVFSTIFYIPIIFRNEVRTCQLLPEGTIIYQRVEDTVYLNSPLFSVYKIVLEVIFKIIPVILLAALNLRILIVYRRSCERRRKMTSRKTSGEDDPKKFAEERRLVLLLGSTSILFLVCVTPMVLLNITLSYANLIHFHYQVFRAIANLLEITNYSITFYIYCSFSEDFRNTLLRTLKLGGNTSLREVLRTPQPTATTTTTQQKGA